MNFLIYDTVESTNDIAKKLAKEGAPHGTAILAHKQLTGRGQHGRVWHSPPGGMWMSIVLQDCRGEGLTLFFGKQIKEILESISGQTFDIKLPNDILHKGKKVCGILTELVTRGDKTYGTVGIGLNVNNSEFPGDLCEIATSLLLIDGIERDIEEIARLIQRRLFIDVTNY